MRLLLALPLVLLALQFDRFAGPPPIALSAWDDRADYHVYDFARDRLETVSRRDGIGAADRNLFNAPPKEVPLPSPYRADVNLIFVGEPADADGNAPDMRYTLYRVNDDGGRLVMRDVALAPGHHYWSPDGTSHYVRARVVDGLSDLYRYDIEAESLTLVLADLEHFGTCQLVQVWCTVAARHGDQSTLYLLDRNSGDLTPITSTAQRDYRIFWERDAPTLIYQAHTDIFSTLYEYDLTTGESRRLIWLPTRWVNHAALSPDGRWLAVEYSLRHVRTMIYLLDLTQHGPPLRPVTTAWESTQTRAQHHFEWLDAETIAFDAADNTREASGFFTYNLMTDMTQTVLDFAGNIYDQDWSPDGRWFAYITNDQLHIVPVDGSQPPRAIDLEVPVNCLVWDDMATLATGTAYLCDKYWGTG